MIDPALLADIQGSKNLVLLRVCELVRAYNTKPQTAGNPQANQEAIKLLDKVMKHAARYLTSKPPNAKDKNKRKWDALTGIAQQAASESQVLGVKLLSGPADFRRISGAAADQSYWLERVDPQHRPGFKLSPEYGSWLASAHAIAMRQPFWDYVGGRGADMGTVRMVKGLDPTSDDPIPLLENYRITFDATRAARDFFGDIFTTKEMETHFSGKGWAIYVCSPAGALYSRSHEVAVFHHSSFLGGRPVAAAGEILIDENGKVRFITGKTGHYRAGLAEMRRLVQLLPELPPEAFIMPVFANKKVYRVDDFRARGDSAKIRVKHEVEDAIPYWAKARPEVMSFIALQPTSRPLDTSAPAFVPAARPALNPNAPAFVPRRV